MNTITISVRLFGTLRDLLPKEAKGRAEIELDEGATVADLLAHLKADGPIIVGINEAEESELDHVLQDGDKAVIFMMAAGGD